MEGLKVLLVDDEEDFRTTLANRLRKRKLEVSEAEGGPEALASMNKQVFDVVVLDVRMPGMDGIEVLKRVKESHPLVEVIMLTGHASVESGIEGMRLGAFDYLMKPCDINDLIVKIQDAYQRKLVQEAGQA
jgi:two-component system, OmpR family, response regulator